MKIFLISLLLGGVAVFGASQVSLELAAGIAVLTVSLLLMQWILRRNTEVVAQGRTSAAAARHTPKPPQEPSSAGISGIDSDVFARFRENLQLQEQPSAPSAPVAAAPADAEALPENSDVVRLSSHPQAPESPPAFNTLLEQAEHTPSPAPSGEKVTLRSSKTTRSAGQTFKRAARSESVYALPKLRQPEMQRLQQTLPDNTEELFADAYIPLEPANNPSVSTDYDYEEGLSQTLGHHDSSEDNQAEAEALLQMAQAFAKQHNWNETKLSLDNHMALLKDLQQSASPEALQLYVQAHLQLGDVQQAARHFEGVRQSTNGLDSAFMADLTTRLLEGLEQAQAYERMVPLLQDLLNYHRQELNRDEMDRLYGKLTKALEVMGDEDRLLRTCQSHLEIKRGLNDQSGEEQLLKKLGRLHHRRGEKDLSRQYYEETLRLRGNVERAAY
jgi:hypothetical protein